MNTTSPFSADHSKMAYAQAFTRSSTTHHPRTARRQSLRGLSTRLHRTTKTAR